MSKKIILLAGPTASGKSKLAIHLAKKLNGEIINADSMQIYKEFSILSSRPTKLEIKKAKHHLYGIISVKKYFSTGDWLNQAKKKIKICLRKKKIPIIVGGTGLYFNTITKGISKIPNIDSRTRTKVRNLKKSLLKSGINYDQIIQSINNLASSKATLEGYYEEIFKDTIKKTRDKIFIDFKKFDQLNLDLKMRVINKSIKILKKNYYNPRSKKVINLINFLKTKNFKKSTLAGCIFYMEKDYLCLKTEKK